VHCPFPATSEAITWVRDACRQDFSLLMYLVSVSLSAFFALLLVAGTIFLLPTCATAKEKLLYAFDLRDESNLTPGKTVAAVFVWLFACVDIFSDILFNVAMYGFIASLPLSDSQCRSCDVLYQPALVPGLNVNDIRDFDFQLYLSYLDNYMTQVGYELGTISPDSYATMRADTIDVFQAQCEAMNGCIFLRSENGCRSDPGYNPFPVFRTLIAVACGVVLCKELAKVACVVYLAATADFQRKAVVRACATSCMLPLLVLRPGGLRAVALCQPSNSHVLWEFLFECVCENIPQLVLSYIYTAHVTGIGLSSWQMVSIYLSGCVFVKNSLEAGWAVLDLYRGKDSKTTAGRKLDTIADLQLQVFPSDVSFRNSVISPSVVPGSSFSASRNEKSMNITALENFPGHPRGRVPVEAAKAVDVVAVAGQDVEHTEQPEELPLATKDVKPIMNDLASQEFEDIESPPVEISAPGEDFEDDER
jgi:hypothetical protein